MPGPNSAPNGDKSLTDDTTIYCGACRGDYRFGWFRKRDHLAKHGKLRTGKTGR